MTSTRPGMATTNVNTMSKRPTQSVTAQDLLTLKDTVIKNGLLRKRGKKLNIGKWPHRFVILTYDSVYIYTNETSKSPNTKLCLNGYNKVARCDFKGQNWCFSIVPAENIVDQEVKTFACVSDADRKAWMTAVKNQMYVANGVTKPVLNVSDKMRSMNIIDVDDYSVLEQLVYSPSEGMNTRNGSFFDNDDDADISDESDFDNSSQSSGKRETSSIKTPSPHKSKPADDNSLDSSKSHSYEELTIQPSVGTTGESLRRKSKDLPPKPPVESSESSSNGYQNQFPTSAQPPRYSEVYLEEEETDYVNATVFKKCTEKQTLEAMCTIIDPNPDRDKLIAMLQAKQVCGTYLIRNSRKGDQKVITYLSSNGQAKEYKIFGSIDRPTLDQKKYFNNVEELLQYYTSVAPLPSSIHLLGKGIHDKTT